MSADARRDPEAAKPTVQMPSEGQRALARAIVEEFRPTIEQMVANAMLQFHQRLSSLEEWKRQVELAREERADITGKFDLPTLQRKREEADERVKRKLARLEMERVAANAIEKAERQGLPAWLARNGWKLVGAALAIWNAVVTYLRFKK